MPPTPPSPSLPLPRDLGDGLILRRATVADTDALADFNARMHHYDDGSPQEGVRIWTQDMLRGDHPAVTANDFLIVEETRTKTIASTVCFIGQQWAYDGVPFGVGRPELVGTNPRFRGRGLVRTQFAVLHEWSAARGDHLQAITGIRWYYRQFGYEYALDLEGGRHGAFADVPALADDATEPYILRPAAERDIPFLAALDAAAAQRQPVTCLRDDALWEYELHGKTSGNVGRRVMFIIEDAQTGAAVGFVSHPVRKWQGRLWLTNWEMIAGVSWAAVAPSVLRFMRHTGEQMAQETNKPCTNYLLAFGAVHPSYAVLASKLNRTDRPYAWYLRVTDVPGFVRHIAPALERRIAVSPVAGYTGELLLNFYRSGVRMVWAAGRLTACEPWQPPPEERGDAAFPDRTFLQLVFGFRSLDALEAAFPDCRARTDEARAVLNAIFPLKPSEVWAIA